MAERQAGLEVALRGSKPIAVDVALECPPGELLALVGPSGSGKSTILRMIAGLLEPDAGHVRCMGETWYSSASGLNRRARERHVGMVFQSFALFPHLTALENVMEALTEHPSAERTRRARDLLARMHLAGLEDRKPAMLSGGQQQRVAVARALAREPEVMLLDEPFSAVDRVTRERLYQELAELRRDLAMPVILVTHDFDEALLLADRMCVLSEGKTLQWGAPDEVISRPNSVQVARLVGLKNVFRAGVIEHIPERNVTVIEWRKHRLEARLQRAFEPRSQVAWVIPQGQFLLHGVDQTPRGELENQVAGTVDGLVRLGDNAVLSINVGEPGRPLLYLSVPIHVAQRNRIEPGMTVILSLLGEGIHLLPPDKSLAPDPVMAL